MRQKRIINRAFLVGLALLMPLCLSCGKSPYDQGLEYYKEGKLEKAVREFKLALHEEPLNHNAYFNLGVIYNLRKEYWGGRTTLQLNISDLVPSS